MVATHDASFAAQFTDEVILLSNGNLVAHEATEHVLNCEDMDRVFETRFGRFPTTSGQTMLFPELDASVAAAAFVPLSRSIGGTGSGLD